MLELFDAQMCELDSIGADERLVQIHTTNDMDSLYAFVPTELLMDSDKLDDEAMTAVRRRKSRGTRYIGFTDVTDAFFGSDGNAI